jgi:hypothetical protein
MAGLGDSYGVERIAYYKMRPEMGPPDTTIWEYPGADSSWVLEIRAFLEDIECNRDPEPGLGDAIEVLKVVQEIYRQSESVSRRKFEERTNQVTDRARGRCAFEHQGGNATETSLARTSTGLSQNRPLGSLSGRGYRKAPSSVAR